MRSRVWVPDTHRKARHRQLCPVLGWEQWRLADLRSALVSQLSSIAKLQLQCFQDAVSKNKVETHGVGVHH